MENLDNLPAKKNRKPEKIVWITNMFMDDACSEREKFGTQSSTTYFFYKSRFVISVFFLINPFFKFLILQCLIFVVVHV